MRESGRVQIRAAVPDDAEALTQVHEACWRDAYASLLAPATIDRVFADPVSMAARRRERLSDPGDHTLVAERDLDLVGFASAGPGRRPDPPTELELYALYTRATEWGRGTGYRLITAAIGETPAHLWVIEGNTRAIAFYRRQGFELDGAVDDEPPERQVLMVRSPRT